MLGDVGFHDLLVDHFLSLQVTSNLDNAKVHLEENWMVPSFSTRKFNPIKGEPDNFVSVRDLGQIAQPEQDKFQHKIISHFCYIHIQMPPPNCRKTVDSCHP